MARSQHESRNSGAGIPAPELPRLRDAWLIDGRYRQLSPSSLEFRKHVLDKLVWWLGREGLPAFGPVELKAFLAYIPEGHKDPGGRWGNPRMTRPVRPRTVKDYHNHLRIFARWLVQEEYAASDLMRTVRAPVVRREAVQPFTEGQIAALLEAARRAKHSRRDGALVLFLLDTGVRAAEACGLRTGEVDLLGRQAVVTGKGSKRRAVYFGPRTARALARYLRDAGRSPEEPVFLSERGEALTTGGLFQAVRRLGRMAGLEAVRCSPHTFRHTAAVMFLRAGGNVFALKEMLGHTTLSMTQRYVSLAQADVQAQHAQFSPVEALRGMRR